MTLVYSVSILTDLSVELYLYVGSVHLKLHRRLNRALKFSDRELILPFLGIEMTDETVELFSYSPVSVKVMDIYLAASRLGKYPSLFTSTSVNNCYY